MRFEITKGKDGRYRWGWKPDQGGKFVAFCTEVMGFHTQQECADQIRKAMDDHDFGAYSIYTEDGYLWF